MVGASHNVAKEGYSIAIVSSVLDNPTDTAGAEKEIEHGLRLLGPIHQKFVFINELFEPKYLKNAENKKEGLFISNSFDATSHFETVCLDVLRLYKEVIGKDLVLKSWEELAKEAPAQ
jgi:Rab GDP dissociation inhibitor